MTGNNVMERFLENYGTSTRYGYSSALFCYLDVIYNYSRQNKRATKEDRAHYEMLAARYISEVGRDYSKDILYFQSHCNKPTTTIENYRSVVLEFLRCNNIRIEAYDFKRIKQKTPKRFELRDDTDLTIEVIKQILEHSDVRMKALFLTLMTTGLRVSEVLSFKLEHFKEIDDGFGKLHLEWYDNKVGREVYTLTTPECVGMIKEWLKVRSKYLKEKCIHQSKKADTGEIFPFTKSNATEAFHNIQERIGYTKNGKGDYPLHFQQFRKYYLSQLNLVISPEITQYLIGGHSRDIAAIYRRYSFAQVTEEYKKGADAITIGTDPVLKRKYKDSIEEIEGLKENQTQNNNSLNKMIEMVHEMREENRQLNKRITDMENEQKSWFEKMRSIYGRKTTEI